MNQRQFLSELKRLRKEHPEYKARVVSTSDFRRVIRLRDGNGLTCCPITFVCFLKTGTLFDPSNWRVAASNLGLRDPLGEMLVDAADNWHEFEWESQLQKRMCAALGL